MQSVAHLKDEQLVQALISNDETAWERFISKYNRLLMKILSDNQIPKYDLVEEMDELIVKLVETIGNYNPDRGSLSTWLHTVTRHFAIDRLKSKQFKQRQQTLSIEALEEEESGYVDTHGRDHIIPEPADFLQNERMYQLLKENFRERQRKLIFLKFYKDLSWEQIAQELVPNDYPSLDAAKVDFSRMAKKMKIILEKYGC